MLEGVAQRVVGAVRRTRSPDRRGSCGGKSSPRRGFDLGALDRQELAGDAGIVAGELREQGETWYRGRCSRSGSAQCCSACYRYGRPGAPAITHHTADAVEELAFIVDLAGAGEVDLAVVRCCRIAPGSASLCSALGRRLTISSRPPGGVWPYTEEAGPRSRARRSRFQVSGFRVGERRVAAAGRRGIGSVRSRARASSRNGYRCHSWLETMPGMYLTASSRFWTLRACICSRVATEIERGASTSAGVSLGTGGCAVGQVALDRTPGSFGIALTNDAGLRQGHNPLRNRPPRLKVPAATLLPIATQSHATPRAVHLGASNWPWTGAEVLPAASDGLRVSARPAWLAIWFRVVASGAAGRL